jgi:tetratricopeptide (TPR) repeat protein
MASRRKHRKNPPSGNPPPSAGKPPPSKTTPTGPAGRKLWRFRLLAALGAPVLFLLLLEFGLRLVGYGYPTRFLLPRVNDGRKTWSQNNRFGWRFFGPEMAREPVSFSIPRVKPPGTIRIFVFGESAAYGDPDPAFGLPRMLQALLELRYPGVKFEIVNTALTGINSNVILPIARDCAGADGDVWVIYLGNNEVVGPFGAGTIFGAQAPPVSLIRAGLAFKTTRLGELFDAILRTVHKPPTDKTEWGGMLMFLDQQVRADDSRMNAVYRNFQKNLADIIAAGQRGGAGIVVSTVAVNLRDSAPFASLHRPNLTPADKSAWDGLYQRGMVAQNSNSLSTAAACFQDAAKIDNTFADLRFRQGECALALGDPATAREQFSAARDLDTLRFRCDSRLNDIIRQTVSNRESEHILLADAENAFARHSDAGLPGSKLFYEHVHLTFDGNYLLALTIAPEIARLLPSDVAAHAAGDQPWPSEADCERRLGWSDWSRQQSLVEIANRIAGPPFTSQLNHDAETRRLNGSIATILASGRNAELRDARKRGVAALSLAPDDPVLLGQLASFCQLSGDTTNAELFTKTALAALPEDSGLWANLGTIYVAQLRFGEAAGAFQRAFELDSQDVWSLCNFAETMTKLNRPADAERYFRRAIAVKPRFGPAWLGLGLLLEKTGHKEEADHCFSQALLNRVHRAPELISLARFCRQRGRFQDAVNNYEEAIALSPGDAMLCLEDAQCLAALGRNGDAEKQFAAAARLAPDLEEARFLYGLELGQEGKQAGAIHEFQEAVRIMPDLVEARLNLGIALSLAGSNTEALAQFQQVLQRSPTNQIAQHYVQSLTTAPAH